MKQGNYDGHVHSTHSDGKKTVPELIALAHSLGLGGFIKNVADILGV